MRFYDLAFDHHHVEDSIPNPNIQQDHHPCYKAYLHRAVQIRHLELHAHLQLDLMKEIWRLHMARQGSQS